MGGDDMLKDMMGAIDDELERVGRGMTDAVVQMLQHASDGDVEMFREMAEMLVRGLREAAGLDLVPPEDQ